MKLIQHYSKSLLIGASLIALGAPAIAQAQAAPGGNAVSEVIVTAQRRSERLQDVPISITAVSAAALSRAGVSNVTELGKLVPGVNIPMYGGFVQPSIRGIASNVAGAGDSANTAIYLDGVYQAVEFALNFDLPDVQSVQVLKGPQGTLYGQNAAAGAIIIDTVTPSSTFKGKASISYGNYNDVFGKGYVTGPISDTLAFMVSGAFEQHDGWNKNLLTGGHDKGLNSETFRAKLQWRPINAVSLTASVFYSKRSDSNANTGPALYGNTATETVRQVLFPNLPQATYGHTFTTNVPGRNDVRTYGMSLLGKFQIGAAGTLNTVSAYQNVRYVYGYDIDKSLVNDLDYQAIFPDQYFLQEVNFVSNKFLDRFQVTGGLFFMDRVSEYTPNDAYVYSFGNPYAPVAGAWSAYPTRAHPLLSSGTHTKIQKYSYAGYLEGNVDLTRKLSLTLAGRYSYETTFVSNTPLPGNFLYGQPLPALKGDPRGTFKFDKFTPKGVLRYKFDPNNEVYFSASQGFKSGFVNSSNVNKCVDAPGTPPGSCIDKPVQPEVVTAYEVGYKGRLNSQLSLTLAGFHYDYSQIQLFVYSPLGASYYLNAAAGAINGGEASIVWTPTPDLTVNLGGAYTDAKYTNFPDAPVYDPLPGGGNHGHGGFNATGKPMIRAPKVTVDGSFNYMHNFASLGTAGLYVGVNYTSAISYDVAGRIQQEPYALLDSELSFVPESMPKLRLVIWGKNLSNVTYFSSVLVSNVSDNVTFSPPRTFGVRAEYQF